MMPPFMALGEPPPPRWCFSTSSSTRETPSSAEIRRRPGHRKKSVSFQSITCFWIGPEFSNRGSFSLVQLSGGFADGRLARDYLCAEPDGYCARVGVGELRLDGIDLLARRAGDPGGGVERTLVPGPHSGLPVDGRVEG